MTLDPDDPRPPYLQVAVLLKAAIATGQLKPGERLASGNEMAKTYGVARQTIQQALRVLRDDGLIVSRQGSGTFVRARMERPVGLRPHIEAAFESPTVTIDFAGFSGETLASALQEPLDKIRSGRRAPTSIVVRVLIPDPDHEWGLPALQATLADSPEFRQRAAGIAGRSLEAMSSSLHELQGLGLVEKTSLQVRVHATSPHFKCYILNGNEAFFGFYPVTEHHVTYKGQELQMWDLVGKDSMLFQHSRGDEESLGGLFIEQVQRWFDSMWTSIARDYDV